MRQECKPYAECSAACYFAQSDPAVNHNAWINLGLHIQEIAMYAGVSYYALPALIWKRSGENRG